MTRAVLARSYIKGSKIASWIGFREALAWNRLRREKATDVFICPSRFMAEKMVQGGLMSARWRCSAILLTRGNTKGRITGRRIITVILGG